MPSPASGFKHARLVPGFPHRAPHGAGGCGLGGRLGPALIDPARGQVTRSATFCEPGRWWLPRQGQGRTRSRGRLVFPGEQSFLAGGLRGARAARRWVRSEGSTAPRLGDQCRETRAPSRGGGLTQQRPTLALQQRGRRRPGEDQEEEPELRAALAHKVVESPFPGGGERAAPGAGFLPPRAEEEPRVPFADRATSGSGAPLLSGHSCRGKTPACACPQASVWTVLFLAELPGRKIAQVRGRFQSGVNFGSPPPSFGSCRDFHVSLKKKKRSKTKILVTSNASSPRPEHAQRNPGASGT